MVSILKLYLTDDILLWFIGFVIFVIVITLWLVLRVDEFEEENSHPNFLNKYSNRK